jgi:hypothetical protein
MVIPLFCIVHGRVGGLWDLGGGRGNRKQMGLMVNFNEDSPLASSPFGTKRKKRKKYVISIQG